MTKDSSINEYDLVVVGAGMSGLNALFAAVQYLPKDARVLLLEKRDVAGGMWNTAYNYVRLHQPHAMFTVGNMKWNWRKSRDYLANRDEIQKHLVSSLARSGAKVHLETMFGHVATDCQEIETEEGWRAQVTYHPNSDPNQSIAVIAKRAIHAAALNYQPAPALPLSSQAVSSVVPDDLSQTLTAHPKAPLYVVGGGKTGMDTCLEAMDQDADRKIVLINGRGTHFLNRSIFFPNGVKRWTSGVPVSRFSRDLATTFDGDNEEDIIGRVRSTYSTDPAASNGVFLYAFQSEAEHAALTAGLTDTLMDYLTDVTDTPQGPQLSLRSGETMPVEAGSIFVNCTGTFFKEPEMPEYKPCLSPNDTVLTFGTRDGFHFLPGVAAFFLTHLLYRDSLRNNGFYTFDHATLFRKNRNAWVAASASQGYMNAVNAIQTLPLAVLDGCGLDFDRWYPLPRRLNAMIQIKKSAKQDIAHCQKVLDRVFKRFDVSGGPISATNG